MKKFIYCMIIVMLLTGCGVPVAEVDISEQEATKNYAFTQIEEDNSGTLTMGTQEALYYYLNDTKIVYVGFTSASVYSGSNNFSPVISENGKYLKYDEEKKEVVEVD